MEQTDIVVAVAAHKPYRMPEDSVYLPVHVGRALHPDVIEQMGPGFVGDNTGDSISDKNDYYCELTGLWWLWKNVDADYKGLVQYRRHFATQNFLRRHAKDRFERIATGDDFRKLIDDGAIVIVPKRRQYYIETIRSHWCHTMPAEQLDAAYGVVTDFAPDYLPAFDAVLDSTSAHLFNMFVMRSDLLDEYCSWLFPLLFKLEERLDPSNYDAFLARYPGRISEMLLDVWLSTEGIAAVELSTVSPEPVNWFKKGSAFLAAKFLGQKYETSF